MVRTDHSVGEILRGLDECGLKERTLVVFPSDNGAHWLPAEITRYGHPANGPWRGQKADIHEGGHRVPCLVRWPGRVRPGTATSQLAYDLQGDPEETQDPWVDEPDRFRQLRQELDALRSAGRSG